jgi:hypothetical protein
LRGPRFLAPQKIREPWQRRGERIVYRAHFRPSAAVTRATAVRRHMARGNLWQQTCLTAIWLCRRWKPRGSRRGVTRDAYPALIGLARITVP